jgi:hypothetical protein
MRTLITWVLLAVPVTACSSSDEAIGEGSTDPAAVQAAVLVQLLAQVLELAEQDLEANDAAPRPFCIAAGQEPYPETDPPPEVLDATERAGMDILPMSQCDLQTFRTHDGRRAGLVWAAWDPTGGSTVGAGGFVFDEQWGQEFECPVQRDGEETTVGVCRLTARI